MAAGWGAADYAAPEWTAALRESLLAKAETGLILPRTVVGSALHTWGVQRAAARIVYDIAPRLDLTPGWNAIQARRSSRTWSSHRRKFKKLSELGEISVVRVRDEASLHKWLPAVFALYRARASAVGRTGLWTRPDGQRFLREWMTALAGEGTLDLSILVVGAFPVAFTFGIRDPEDYYLYGLGFDPKSEFARWSPGEHLLVDIMKEAAESGLKTFDFLVGDEPYKSAWADQNRQVETLVFAGGKIKQSFLAVWPRARQYARSTWRSK
ncbi:MAG: CelD/BcsL family acetyltransferase involved in cellulose biosynthesis [Rhodothermales bacterium]